MNNHRRFFVGLIGMIGIVGMLHADMAIPESIEGPHLETKSPMKMERALDIFWQQALVLGQCIEENTTECEFYADTLAKFHDEALTKELGKQGSFISPFEYVRKVSTKSRWDKLQAVLQSKDEFRNRFDALVQHDYLGSSLIEPGEFKEVLKEFQTLINDYCEVAGANSINEVSDISASVQDHLRLVQTRLHGLANALSTNKSSSFWYDRMKNLLWGSSFSHDVLPKLAGFILPLMNYVTMRNKNFNVEAASMQMRQEFQKMDNMGFFQRLFSRGVMETISRGKMGIMVDQLKNMSTHLSGQNGMSFYAIKQQLMGEIFREIGDIFKIAQDDVYKQRKREEDKKVNRAKSKVKRTHETDIHFKDIIGYEDAKDDLRIIINALSNPVKFMRYGGELPKGMLLEGPPGTGKTLFARAIAGEAKCPFYVVNVHNLFKPMNLQDMFSNNGDGMRSGINELEAVFEEARECGPSIICIDELDFVGKRRDQANNPKEREVLAQLLKLLDGFEAKNRYKPVFVIATTNCAEDLDQALTRANRFDIKIHVDLPSLETRKNLFKKHIPARVRSMQTIDFDELAAKTEGYNCADIVAIVKKHASMIAEGSGRGVITMDDLLAAIDKNRHGLTKQI